jgi:hypothetical protein
MQQSREKLLRSYSSTKLISNLGKNCLEIPLRVLILWTSFARTLYTVHAQYMQHTTSVINRYVPLSFFLSLIHSSRAIIKIFEVFLQLFFFIIVLHTFAVAVDFLCFHQNSASYFSCLFGLFHLSYLLLIFIFSLTTCIIML